MLTSRIESMKKFFLALLPMIFFGCKPSVNDEGASQVQHAVGDHPGRER